MRGLPRAARAREVPVAAAQSKARQPERPGPPAAEEVWFKGWKQNLPAASVTRLENPTLLDYRSPGQEALQ